MLKMNRDQTRHGCFLHLWPGAWLRPDSFSVVLVQPVWPDLRPYLDPRPKNDHH